MSFKSGFVGIIGRPNAGKSTLLNSLVEASVAITSYKASTTRNVIKGILTTDDYQIVFMDTPGIQKAENSLSREMNKRAFGTMHTVDIIYYIVDGTKRINKYDEFIMKSLKENNNIPVILLVNKLDKLKMAERLQALDNWNKMMDFAEVVPISALQGKNIEMLLDITQKYLKEGEPFYDSSIVTDQPDDFFVSEVIRKHTLLKLSEEVPHSIAVVVDEIKYKKEVVSISAVIVVERDSQKGIVIGKGGEMIKQINTESRLELEEYFNKKVFLEVFVQVQKDWRNRPDKLKELISDNTEYE